MADQEFAAPPADADATTSEPGGPGFAEALKNRTNAAAARRKKSAGTHRVIRKDGTTAEFKTRSIDPNTQSKHAKPEATASSAQLLDRKADAAEVIRTSVAPEPAPEPEPATETGDDV